MTRESLGEFLKLAGLGAAIATIILLSMGCTSGMNVVGGSLPLPEGEHATLLVNTEWHDDLAIFVLPIDSTPTEVLGIARASVVDGKTVIYLHCWTLPLLDSVKIIAVDIDNVVVKMSEAIYIPDARNWTWDIASWSRRVKKSPTHCIQGLGK